MASIAERPIKPDRAALDESLDVLTPNQRQKVAEFFAVQIEQHVAMAHLLLSHLVVHFGRVRVRFAQRVGEGAIDAVILVLIGDRERENLLLA